MTSAKNKNTKKNNQASASSKKRALIITYYWPPAGGPGVQRWLKFVTYFKEFGVDPVVYTPENPHYPLQDKSIIDEAPSDIEILKFPINEPYKFAKVFSKNKTKQISSGIITNKNPSVLERMMLWVRGNFFIPDARIGWVKPSVEYLNKYLTKNPVDVIISSGPPHSLHLIAKQLNKKTAIPWIADFRDPWTTIHYHKSLKLSGLSKKKHEKLEKEVLNAATNIVVTSANTKKEFEKKTKTPITVITNGYEVSKNIVATLDTAFSLVHIGSLLSNRNPKILWEVLSELLKEDTSFKKDFKLKLVGAVSEDILASIHEFGLDDNCEIVGYVSHKKAIQLQHNAQVLLMIEMDTPETRAIIPGKLFEYIAAHRPIIALGPKGSDVATIITETNSGYYFTFSEKEQLQNQLRTYYKKFKEDALLIISKNTAKYRRSVLTQKMVALINKSCKK